MVASLCVYVNMSDDLTAQNLTNVQPSYLMRDENDGAPSSRLMIASDDCGLLYFLRKASDQLMTEHRQSRVIL